MLMARIAVFAMLVVGGPVIRSVHMIGAMVVLGRVLRRPTSGRCRGRGSRGFLRDAHLGQCLPDEVDRRLRALELDAHGSGPAHHGLAAPGALADTVADRPRAPTSTDQTGRESCTDRACP